MNNPVACRQRLLDAVASLNVATGTGGDMTVVLHPQEFDAMAERLDLLSTSDMMRRWEVRTGEYADLPASPGCRITRFSVRNVKFLRGQS